jgi:hypothetical protein
MTAENKNARRDALAAGRKTYVCGKPCAVCGSSIRYTANGLCIECDKIKRAAVNIDPDKLESRRAAAAARVARHRAKQKAARLARNENTESDEFADILG